MAADAVHPAAPDHDQVSRGHLRRYCSRGTRRRANSQEREKALELFSSFANVPIEPPVWELAGDISAKLRVLGTPVMLADLVIAATAIHHHLRLWTRDKHFGRVRAVAPQLAIFDESNA